MNTIAHDRTALLRNAGESVQRLLPEVFALYVFGSFAGGREHADSDLDLAVLAERPLDPLRRLEAQRELGRLLDRDVDLIDLHRANTVLGREVVTRGRALFKQDTERALDFEARTIGDYARLMDATQDIRADIVARLRARVS